MVSVIMPVFNAEKYLNEAIESILAQSFTDFEFFIIDDCSSDKSREVVRSYNDERIVFIEKPVNTGYTDSLNMAINLAKGKYIARMDADDISMPNRLKKQVDFMEQHLDVAVCGTWFEKIPSKKMASYPVEHEDVKLALLNNSPIGHPTAMIRKSVLMDYDLLYNRDYEPAEDYELWTRILRVGRLANVPEILLKYREHAGQISTVKLAKQLKKAGWVRVNLLNQMAGPLNNDDLGRAQKIFGLTQIKNATDLQDALNWLTTTRDLNKKNNFFKQEGFSDYIDSKTKQVVRNYYLNRKRHVPAILFDFIRTSEDIKKNLSLRDKAVLTLKSLLSWKSE